MEIGAGGVFAGRGLLLALLDEACEPGRLSSRRESLGLELSIAGCVRALFA